MAGSTEKTRITLSYDCPVPPTSKHLYSDHFARTRALPFIAASNARDVKELTECLRTHFNNVKVLERIVAPCDSSGNECAVYVAYNPLDNAIVIAFRSTNSAAQVSRSQSSKPLERRFQLLVEAVDFMLQTQKDFQPVGGRVVSYFYDSFFALWNGGLEHRLRSSLLHFPKAEVWIFGHSLGGALASLAAAWISRMGIVRADSLKFVSFGQPRTGDMKFALAFDSLVPFKYRVVHKHDAITQMPVRLPFTQVTNDMEPTAKCSICLRAEDPNCSQGEQDPPDPAIHRRYFNVTLADWPRTGCRLPPDLYHAYRQPLWMRGTKSHG
ncbi:Lipase, class 3 family-containing protein [Aphelenchoides fujianensis]|nr:Lipase, class 3 family-containing protein [Aphelenchoides fujianensis]